MAEKKVTRVERFKNDIEESKMYQSIEQKTIEDSKLIREKKENLKKIDPDFFTHEVNSQEYKIKFLESKQLLDYNLKNKISKIEDQVSKEHFEISKPKLIKEKIPTFKSLSEIYKSLNNRSKTFDYKMTLEEVEWNKQISQLNEMKSKMEKNSQFIEEEDLNEFSKIQEEIFNKTENVKLSIFNTQGKNEKKELQRIKNKKEIIKKYIIPMLTIVIIILILLLGKGI